MSHIINKEEKAKENNLKEPPPPTSSTIPPAKPAGGGGLDLVFTNFQGKQRTITESEVYRYMLKYPQFTTDIVMQAISEARTPPNPVNDPFSYLVGICNRLMHNLNKTVEVKTPEEYPIKLKVYAPGVNVGELMKKMEAEEKSKRVKERNDTNT